MSYFRRHKKESDSKANWITDKYVTGDDFRGGGKARGKAAAAKSDDDKRIIRSFCASKKNKECTHFAQNNKRQKEGTHN